MDELNTAVSQWLDAHRAALADAVVGSQLRWRETRREHI